MSHCVVNPRRRSNPAAGGTLLLAACLLMTTPPQAGELDVRHGGPIIGLFGIPGPGESLALAAGEQRRLDLLVQGASHSIGETSGDEELLLDGESWRTALRFRARLGDRLEIGMEIPWLRNSAGSFDGLIDDWHALFGLPDGIRDERPRNELLYGYRNEDGESFEYASGTSGLGDIRLTAGWPLSAGRSGRLSLRAAIELPTGDEAKLTGNGSADYSLGLTWERGAPDMNARWSTFLSGGVVRFGETDIPAVRTREWGGWLNAGLGWRITPDIELIAQLQSATSPLDSGLDAWGGSSLMLGLGAGFDIGRHYRLDLGFTEDIAVESAPDITFLLRLSRR